MAPFTDDSRPLAASLLEVLPAACDKILMKLGAPEQRLKKKSEALAMKRILVNFLSLAHEFAPMLALHIVNSVWGLKAGIAASLVVTVLSVARLLVSRRKPTSYFVFSVAISLLSAAVDLSAETPFIIKYESVATNVFFGLFFLQSCFRGTPIITEFALRTMKVEGLGALAYLRGLTMVWAAQFFVKAVIYLWMVEHLSFEQALVVRAFIGKALFWGLLLGERVVRKPLAALLHRWQLLPSE